MPGLYSLPASLAPIPSLMELSTALCQLIRLLRLCTRCREYKLFHIFEHFHNNGAGVIRGDIDKVFICFPGNSVSLIRH